MMSKRLDLTGQTFGRLIVLSYHGNDNHGSSRWDCRCVCGVPTVVLGVNLTHGRTKSCGCSQGGKGKIISEESKKKQLETKANKSEAEKAVTKKKMSDSAKIAQNRPEQKQKLSESHKGIDIIDETGHVFGRLTVLSFEGIDKQKAASWMCQCVCGNQKVVSGCNLRRGTTKSCGCLSFVEDNFRLQEGYRPYMPGEIYFCICGCYQEIKFKRHYRIYGVPRYITGHSRLHQVFPTKDTEPERVLQEALIKSGIKFDTHIPIKGQPDIKIDNLLIFVDGDYYHADPGKYKSDARMLGGRTAQQIWDKDKRITDYLINKGYTVLRFWEHEIHNNLEECVNKIKEVLGVKYVFQN